MKKIALGMLSVYQKAISPLFHQALGVKHACRYFPTCSEYAKIHIERDGVLIGTIKALIRLLYCQPYTKRLPVYLQK